MATVTPLEVVREWVSAVNALDVPAVMSRSSSDIELGGPRGVTRGAPRLREWVERARLFMETRRTFARDQTVVLFQHAVWRDPGGLTVAEAAVATRFVVADGRVAVAMRHDSLGDALREAGLGDADEIV